MAKPASTNTKPAASSAETADSAATRLISLALISASNLNPRKTFDADGLKQLAASIKEKGLLQNLVVRPATGGGFELVAGERRWRALHLLARQNDWDPTADNVQVRIVHADDAEALTLALLENLQRQDVNPMEEAEAITHLNDLDPKKWSAAAIARKINVTPRMIQQRMTLVRRLSPKVQAALRTGKISFTQARVLTVAAPECQDQLLGVISTYARTEDLRRAVARDLIPVKRARFNLRDIPPEQIITGDDDTQYFADRAWFVHRQRQWCDTEKERLQKTWAWVVIDESVYFSSFRYDKSDDRSVAGAVIHIDPAGIVMITEGLVAREQKADAGNWEAAEARRKEDEAAKKSFTTQLADKLAADLPTLFRLVTLGQLSDRHPFLNYSTGAPVALFKNHPSFAAITAKSAGAGGIADRVVLRSEGELTAGWAALTELSDPAALQLLADSYAARLSIYAAKWLPLLLDLARGYGLSPPQCLVPSTTDDGENC